MQGRMHSSALPTCWHEQCLSWKAQAVHSSMLHRMVQPAYLAFKQQCRQPSASSSSSGSSSISRVAASVAQHAHVEPAHTALQRVAVTPAYAIPVYGAARSSCSGGSVANSTGHSIPSIPATLHGAVTSSSSIVSSGPAKILGGAPGPPKPGKDSDEFGPNFGGEEECC